MVSVLTVCYTLSFIDRQIFGLLVGPIKAEFGVSDTQIGLLSGLAFSLFYTLVSLPMGRLVDRYSRRIIIGAGVFFWSLMTAACAGAPREQQMHIGAYGEHLGLAFQIRDDLLDAFGDPAKMGKQVGGDLRAGKKTYLLIRGLELSTAAGRTELRDELAKSPADRDVTRMLRVLEDLGVRAETESEVHKHDAQAMAALEALDVPTERKAALTALAAALLQRTS
jgi:hypothetical protein